MLGDRSNGAAARASSQGVAISGSGPGRKLAGLADDEQRGVLMSESK